MSSLYNPINHTHVLFKKAMTDVKRLKGLFDLVLQGLEDETLHEDEGEGLPEWPLSFSYLTLTKLNC